jgi:hypothetical protein
MKFMMEPKKIRISLNLHFCFAVNLGHLNVVEFLYEKKFRYTEWSLVSVANAGHCDVFEYLYRKGFRYSQPEELIELTVTGGSLRLVKFLQNHGYEFGPDHLKLAYLFNHTELI